MNANDFIVKNLHTDDISLLSFAEVMFADLSEGQSIEQFGLEALKYLFED